MASKEPCWDSNPDLPDGTLRSAAGIQFWSSLLSFSSLASVLDSPRSPVSLDPPMTPLPTESSAHLCGTSFLSVLLKEHQISWEAVVIQRAFPDLSPCPFTAVFRHRIYPLSIVSVLHSIFFAGCQHTHTHTHTHTSWSLSPTPLAKAESVWNVVFFFFSCP